MPECFTADTYDAGVDGVCGVHVEVLQQHTLKDDNVGCCRSASVWHTYFSESSF
jgi:hypothetical protein